ncbi:MAG: ATP-binding protein [Nitrospirales bacterium]|nr:ATP-binding protein [Nitrospirales bacterium]
MQAFRTRIRLTALGFIVLLLCLFSVLLYLGLSTILHRHIDEELVTLARQESQHVELQNDHITLSPPGHRHKVQHEEDDSDEEEFEFPEHEEEELKHAIRFSVVFDTNGRVLWSGEPDATRPPLAQDIITRVLEGEPLFETIVKPGRSPIRRIFVPFEIDEQGPYIFQTEKSLRFVEETLWWLFLLLAGASTGLLFLAWWGSGRLAQEALAPVEALSQTAATISGQTLSTRLTLTSPYSEFQRLAQTFNGMLDRLQQVFEGQRRFVADAAHELKTPLTAMKGNFEVTLQRTRSTEEYRETILSNLAEVDRLTTMTKSLLTLAQFVGDRPPLVLQSLDLSPLVEEVMNELSVLAQDNGIRLQTEYRPVPPLTGDSSQLKQALINLLDNALRHTPSGGTITVRVGAYERSIRLSVEDTGPGIDVQHLPHLFERFYRVDHARNRESGGTGLGLAIVKEIVEAHGGTIRAHSQVGQGTTMTIILPFEHSRT